MATKIFDALEKWINRRPGLEYGNYGNLKSYRSELRSIAKQRREALAALEIARALPAHEDLLLDAFQHAFSGRLEWDGKGLHYTTGQYWPTEYRQAAKAVLLRYISESRQAEAAANPKTFEFRDVADIIAANKAAGQHFFDRDTMRYFRCKVERAFVPCGSVGEGAQQRFTRARFVTSEQGPDGCRKYTIREAQPDGSIDTVGEFQQYATLKAAKAAILCA